MQQDLQESGIRCELAEPDSVWRAGVVYLRTGSLSGGFAYPETKTALITQGRALHAGTRRRKQHRRGEEIRTLADIVPGDLVVHALHGIGRFLGIRKLELEGVTKDYITIQYAGKENLYVPVTQLDMVTKYIGPREDSNVKLSRLSSPEWQKTRSNVRRAVKDMADELLALYAKREKTRALPLNRTVRNSMTLRLGSPMWKRKISWHASTRSSTTWSRNAPWNGCSAATWASEKQRWLSVRQ